jgi:hypothetical protein
VNAQPADDPEDEMTAKIHEMPKRPGGEKRGSSRDRRARREWLVSPAAGFGGDGVKVPCIFCQAMMTAAELHVDRIEAGGSYARSNIQPACPPCNQSRGTKTVEVFIAHTATTRDAGTTTTTTTTFTSKTTTRTR